MKNNRGFTLIELLITVAIIGILAAVAASAYIGAIKKAARSEAYLNLENLRMLEEQFFADSACYQPLVAGACPAGPTTFTGTTDIQNSGGKPFLTRFRPGNEANFTFAITVIAGRSLPNPAAVPYDDARVDYKDADDNNLPCYIVTATGIPGTRVCPGVLGDANCDVFAIDCINNKNF